VQLQRKEGIMNKYLFAAVLGLYSTLGCAGAPLDGSDENLGTVSEAFGTDQCATATAVQTYDALWRFTSSTSYGTACNAVDVNSMDLNNFANTVDYTGTLPTNATDCANTFVLANLYARAVPNNPAWSLRTSIEHDGSWNGSSCSVAPIDFGQLTVSRHYRIAATARTYVGANFSARRFMVTTHAE
jgi:hypothetical protein